MLRTDLGNYNSSPSNPLSLGVRRIDPTEEDQIDQKNWFDTIKHDLHDMKITWQDRVKLAADKSEWRRRVTQTRHGLNQGQGTRLLYSQTMKQYVPYFKI